MILHDVGAVIAVRTFDLAGGAKATLSIGMPRSFATGEDYYCPYQIAGIGDGEVRYAVGVDAIQALKLALKLADASLRTSKEYKSGGLDWDGADVADDLGLM